MDALIWCLKCIALTICAIIGFGCAGSIVVTAYFDAKKNYDFWSKNCVKKAQSDDENY